MRHSSRLAAALLIFVSGCSTSHVPKPQTEPNTPRGVAEQQLQSLRNGEAWQLLGLKSKDEADRARLGKAAGVYVVRADELSRYNGGDLTSILHPTQNVVYPVVIDGRGRLLIEVGYRDGKWVPIRDGYQDSAEAFVTFTDRKSVV